MLLEFSLRHRQTDALSVRPGSTETPPEDLLTQLFRHPGTVIGDDQLGAAVPGEDTDRRSGRVFGGIVEQDVDRFGKVVAVSSDRESGRLPQNVVPLDAPGENQRGDDVGEIDRR